MATTNSDERWTAEQCAKFCNDVSVDTWRSYVNRGTSRGRAPAPVGYNPQTGLKEWGADEVRAWHAGRRGEGWRKGQGDHRPDGAVTSGRS